MSAARAAWPERWTAFAGFHISEVRAGRMTPEDAFGATNGWMLTHMTTPWPQQRVNQEFTALVNRDISTHGPFPSSTPSAWSNVPDGNDLPLIHFADIYASLENAWMVRGLLPAVGLAAIYGAPGTGKSFFAMDVSLRVAAGWPVDGRAVKQGPVVYIAAEGANGFKARVQAFREHHAPGNLPFALIPCAVDLLNPKADLARVIAAIDAAMPQLRGPPVLIVVDTLAATFGGGDENSNAMVAYVNNLAVLRDKFDALILVAHHRPKDHLNDTLRGHGSLMGAMDTILRIEGSNLHMVAVTKQKDAEAGLPIAFSLVSVTLGVDDDNESVLGAVVKYLHVDANKPLKGAPVAVLRALTELIDDGGGSAVGEGAWRERWRAGMPLDMKEDTVRKAWSRNRDLLLNLGRVFDRSGYWSLAPISDSQPPKMDFGISAASAQ